MNRLRAPGLRPRQQGLTLVEILVALFVGLFLVAGIIQLYLGSRQTYRFEEALSRIQETGRYALETIARDARSAGFSGCARIWNPEDHLSAVEGVSQATAGDALRADLGATSNTDILTLRFTSGEPVPISAGTASNAITIATNPSEFQGGDSLAISDCSSLEAFTATQVDGDGPFTITPSPKLTSSYSAEEVMQAFVARFRDVTYYISNLALWRRTLPDDGEKLLDGVEDMEVLFGEDNAGGDSIPDLYRPASEVADWRDVLGLRISLLLASTDENLAGEPQPIAWRGGTITPTDTRLRQVFTTTVALRNRLP